MISGATLGRYTKTIRTRPVTSDGHSQTKLYSSVYACTLVILGVREFEYVSVNESQHVRVKYTCDCQYVYMHLCTICYHE